MADAFISHSPDDHAVARAVADALAREGLSVDSGTGLGGAGAEAARCAVWLWSQAAAASVTPEEVQRAIRAWSDGRLVLATLDAAALPVGLRDLQGVLVPQRAEGVDTADVVSEVRSSIDSRREIGLRSIADAVVRHSSPAPPSLRRYGAMPLVATLALLVTAGMTLSLVVGDLAPPRRAGMGMGKSTSAPDAIRPEPKFSPVPPTIGVPSPDVVPAPAPPRQTTEVPRPVPPAPVPTLPQPGGAPPTDDQPPRPTASGAPPAAESFNGVPVVLVVLILGVAIGAGAAWAWSLWMKRASSRPEARPQPLTPAGLPDAAHQVFVSYSRQDGRAVEDLVREIEQAGYAVWIDRHSTGSQRYAAPIVRAIKSSRLVALMCSENAFTSDHVIREVYVAGDYKKPFIAFQLDQSEFPDEVQYFVSGFPRVPIAALDKTQLRTELARLVTA